MFIVKNVADINFFRIFAEVRVQYSEVIHHLC